MSSKHIYSLGPIYCEHCNDYCLHFLTTDRPFFGVGPYSPYNLWMDAIKISRMSCCKCGNESKINEDVKKLLPKLKKANLLDLSERDRFQQRIKGLIDQYKVLDEYNEEKKKTIVDTLYADYQQFEIPYKWFEMYFLIMYNSKLIEKAKSDYLYK